MAQDVLVGDGTNKIQAFALSSGNVNIESGSVSGVVAVHCVDAGAIIITWADGGDPDTIDMTEGQDFAINKAASVAVSSGKFHRMVKDA